MRQRIVLDANAIVSGILGLERERSKPGEVLRRCIDGAFELVTSDYILDESSNAVSRRWFVARGLTRPARSILEAMRAEAVVVVLPPDIPRLCRDPKDDAVIATAIAGNADYLVTGDDDLLVLGTVEGMRILHATDFVALLDVAGDPAADDQP